MIEEIYEMYSRKVFLLSKTNNVDIAEEMFNGNKKKCI